MSFLDAKTFLLELLEHSVDGVLAVDTQGTVVVWNGALERIFGKPRGAAIGQPVFDVLAFLGETGEDWSIRESLWGQQSRTEEKRYFLPETGREGWYQAWYTPLRDPDGEIVGVLGIIRDVTEARQKLEETVQEAQGREEALKRELRRRESPPASSRPQPPSPPPAPRALPPGLQSAPAAKKPAKRPGAGLPPAIQGAASSQDALELPAFLESPQPQPDPEPIVQIEGGPSEFGGDAPIYDHDAALAYVGDAEVLEELVQGFIVSLPEFVREMDHAVGRREFEAVLANAEDVRKAVVTLGGVRATRIATRLEALTREGKFDEVERTWWRLRRELAVFRETLKTSRKAA
jgi:PAS domain S-box-containing protein